MINNNLNQNNVIYQEGSSFNRDEDEETEYNGETEEYEISTDYSEDRLNIIWIYLDPVDKTVHAYESPYHEEIEEAYKNLEKFHIIKDFDSAIVFDPDENYMQIPIKYYVNSIYDKHHLRTIKRLIVSELDANSRYDINIYYDNLFGYKMVEKNQNITGSIEVVNFTINSCMYVKNANPNLQHIWEYAKFNNEDSYNEIKDWTLFSTDIIDKLEDLYKNRYILPHNNKVLSSQITIFSNKFKLNFNNTNRFNDIYIYNYGILQNCNNHCNIYIIRNIMREISDIIYMYRDLRKKNYYNDICSICLESFKDTYSYNSIELECSHRYHVLCLQCIANIKDSVNHKCPLCRDAIDWNKHPEISKCRERKK